MVGILALVGLETTPVLNWLLLQPVIPVLV
jgi:hypothetical protein